MASCCLTQYDHDYVYDPFSKIKANNLSADFSVTTRSDLITCCSTNRNNRITVETNTDNQPCRSADNQRKFHCVTYPIRKTKENKAKEEIKTFNVTTISPFDLSRLLKFYNTKNLTQNNLLKSSATSTDISAGTKSARSSHCVNKTHEEISNRKNVIIKTLVSPNNKKSQLQNLKWHHTSFEPRRSRRKEIRPNPKKSNITCGRQKASSHLPWPVTPLSQALHNLEERDIAVKETVSGLTKSQICVKFKDADPVLCDANLVEENNEKELDDTISVSSGCKRLQGSDIFHVPVKSRKVTSNDIVSHDPGFFEGSASDTNGGTSKDKANLGNKMNPSSDINIEEIGNVDSNILSDEVFSDLFGCDATKLLNEVCYADAIMQENISILDMVFKKPLNSNIGNNATILTSDDLVPITRLCSSDCEPQSTIIEPEEFLATIHTASSFSSNCGRSSSEISSQSSIDFNGLSDTDSGIHSPDSNSCKYFGDLGRSYSLNSETGSMTSSTTCSDNKVFFKEDRDIYELHNDEIPRTSSTETSLLDLDDNQIHIKTEPIYLSKSLPPFFAKDVLEDVTSNSNHDVRSNQDKFITAKMVTVPKWKVALSHDFKEIFPPQISVDSKAVKTDPFEMECCEVKTESQSDVAAVSRIRKLTSCEKGKSIHLWEFIRDVLLNPQHCPSLIKWEDREMGVFKFMQSDAVAAMWGKRKQNPKMTYEKLSRAMRYYYNRGILERVDGRRLVYKFGPNSYGWRKPRAQQTQSKNTTYVTDSQLPSKQCQVKIETSSSATTSNINNNNKTIALKTFSIPLSTSPSWEMTSSDGLTSLPSADVFLCKQIKIATAL